MKMDEIRIKVEEKYGNVETLMNKTPIKDMTTEDFLMAASVVLNDHGNGIRALVERIEAIEEVLKVMDDGDETARAYV